MRTPTGARCSIALLVALVCGAAQAGDSVSPKLDVPVTYGGDEILDSCGTTAEVTGLDPKGDNFLSVRSGPGGKPYREVDRLHTGQLVSICEERGNWMGVVYPEQGHETDCRTDTPSASVVDYRGPCRSGWVFKRYVRVVAG